MYLRFKFCENSPNKFRDSAHKRFFTKIKKNYQTNKFEFRKKLKHFNNFVFAYIAHVKFQKASYNSNRDMKNNVSRDGDGTQNNTSRHFSKTGRRKTND